MQEHYICFFLKLHIFQIIFSNMSPRYLHVHIHSILVTSHTLKIMLKSSKT